MFASLAAVVPYHGKVRMREFEHGVVLINPRKLSGQTYPPAATVTPPDAGSGFHWQRLGAEGGMQDSAHNDGSEVTGTVTLQPGDALFLQRVADGPSGPACPAKAPSALTRQLVERHTGGEARSKMAHDPRPSRSSIAGRRD